MYGDWRKNGLGHRKETVVGKQVIVISPPPPRVCKRGSQAMTTIGLPQSSCGTECKMCRMNEVNDDPVLWPPSNLKWAKTKWSQAHSSYVNQGDVCFYCDKVFKILLRDRYVTIADVTALMYAPEGEALFLAVAKARSGLISHC
jgi:hypothetical protein